MGKKTSKDAEKRRAGRTERRRVMQKQRKAEQRVHRHRAAESPQDGWRLSMKLLAMVPESIRDAAIERFMSRANATETYSGLPPGFALQQTARNAWQVIPPAEHNTSVLIKGLTHAVPELAEAFAWEVADGRVDVEAATAEASQVIASLIERGEIPSRGPEEDEVTIKFMGLLLAGELLTGYQSAVLKYGHEFPELGSGPSSRPD